MTVSTSLIHKTNCTALKKLKGNINATQTAGCSFQMTDDDEEVLLLSLAYKCSALQGLITHYRWMYSRSKLQWVISIGSSS